MTVTPVTGTPAVEFIPLGGIGEFGMNMHPVSYTHLTLPTIYSV